MLQSFSFQIFHKIITKTNIDAKIFYFVYLHGTPGTPVAKFDIPFTELDLAFPNCNTAIVERNILIADRKLAVPQATMWLLTEIVNSMTRLCSLSNGI
jgi:hypothetical protein